MSHHPTVDILIPVYNEGKNIQPVIRELKSCVKTPFRILICYDFDEDNTLTALTPDLTEGLDIHLIKNRGRGVHAAIMTGFEKSHCPCVIVYPADDIDNAPILDEMVEKWREGAEIVAASRFIPGGCMIGCPWLKAALVRTVALSLYIVAGIPVHDPTNGFRLFSRRVLNEIPVESSQGFTYAIELLVKAHRLGWKVAEVPSKWFERKSGQSRFKIFGWARAYLRWYWYAYQTTFLGYGPQSVTLKSSS